MWPVIKPWTWRDEVRGSRGLGLCLKTIHNGALEATLDAGKWTAVGLGTWGGGIAKQLGEMLVCTMRLRNSTGRVTPDAETKTMPCAALCSEWVSTLTHSLAGVPDNRHNCPATGVVDRCGGELVARRGAVR